MSDAVSPLAGAQSSGFCTVSEAGLVGMISLRADLSLAKVAKAVKAATGAAMPPVGAVTAAGRGRVAWMGPDELLLMVDYAAAPAIAARLAGALATSHALVCDVSDARVMFRLHGGAAQEVIAKLSPANLRGFGPGRFCRSRLGQVPAAFHMPDAAGFEIIAFRSVAQYVFGLLTNAARAGSEVNAHN